MGQSFRTQRAVSEMDLRDTLDYKDIISEEFSATYPLESSEQDAGIWLVAHSL